MSVDLATFEKEHVYQRTALISDITADLQIIGQFDAYHERQRSKWGYLMAASGLIGIGSFLALAKFDVLQTQTLIAVGWLGMCLCALIACVVQYLKHDAFDLANRRYELIQEVLRLLEKDSPRDEPVSVRLDLKIPNHATKQVREGKVGPWDVEYFLDPWLDLSGRFLDGTSYRLQGLEKYQARHKTYRSRSGKTKSKSKSKSALEVTLLLKPSGKQYAEPEVIAAKLNNTVQLPEWCQRKSAGLHKDRLQLTAQTKAQWHGKPLPPVPDEKSLASGPHLVAMMFLSLYQALNQSQLKRT